MTPRTDWVTGFLKRYDALDRALVAVGFPPTSPWWRQELDLFLRSGRRRWVIRAGRRAGKSSTLCRLAVCWALYGGWSVPPGDTAVIPFVSVDRDEAGARLRTIVDILRALGASFEQRSDELELSERRLVFRVATCSTRGTVGFTSVAVVGDEMARWESRDTAANPAREVMASLRPTMATQPLAFEVCSSSPWGTDDYHAELFEQGDDAHQVTSFAPTWVANPTLTEERTHELEPDPRVWAREYAAEPGATISAALDPADIAAAFASKITATGRGFVAIDASSLRGDAFTWIGGRESVAGEIAVMDVGGWSGDELRHVSMADIVKHVATRAQAWGTRVVFGDQREEASLRSLFAQRQINFVPYAWSIQSKDDAMQRLRQLLRARKLSLCEHENMRRELVGLKARLMPSGKVQYATNGRDYASALITLMHAHVDGQVGCTERRDTRIYSIPGLWSHNSGARGASNHRGLDYSLPIEERWAKRFNT
jgi:hypothetical protein